MPFRRRLRKVTPALGASGTGFPLKCLTTEVLSDYFSHFSGLYALKRCVVRDIRGITPHFLPFHRLILSNLIFSYIIFNLTSVGFLFILLTPIRKYHRLWI